jgi:hypothetical protein
MRSRHLKRLIKESFRRERGRKLRCVHMGKATGSRDVGMHYVYLILKDIYLPKLCTLVLR